MGRQIVKQPNGKYAIWSSICDNFLYTDLTPLEYINIRVAEQKLEITDKILKIIDQLERGEKPYYQFTKTYEDCLEIIKEMGQLEEDENDKKKG